jgi:hypothetical protein
MKKVCILQSRHIYPTKEGYEPALCTGFFIACITDKPVILLSGLIPGLPSGRCVAT